MNREVTKPIVFVGPSLHGFADSIQGGIEVRPPARRGDLEQLASEDRVGTALLVDGLFGTSLAVSPTECRELLDRGWIVAGAASIGALRAAELYSVGMLGFGDIYMMLRLNIIISDAELAVAYHPDSYAEITVALVQIRAALSRGIFQRMDHEDRWRVLAIARSIYWMERTRDCLQQRWLEAGFAPNVVYTLLDILSTPQYHPKRRDALLAVRYLTATTWPNLPDYE